MAAPIALLLVAAVQAMVQAQQPGTLTRGQVRTMPAEQLTRQLFGDVGRMMFPLPYRDDRRPGPLRALSFQTRPYRTGLAGVCQTDLVFVGFERALGALGDDPAVEPARIQVLDNGYFVNDLALARSGQMTEDAAAPARYCSEIDPRTVPIIVANSEGEVVGAVQRFADLLDSARIGQAEAELDCQDASGTVLDEVSCLRMLAGYRAERIHVIGRLPGCGRNATGVWCERIETSRDDGAARIQILFETPRGDRPDITPTRIEVRPLNRNEYEEFE